jgi:hypothetical protein
VDESTPPLILSLNGSSESAGGRGAPGLVKGLEVEPGDDLNQSSARILGVGRVRISRRHLTEEVIVKVGQIGVSQEVDIIEGVQELAAQLEVDFLGDLEPLDRAQI